MEWGVLVAVLVILISILVWCWWSLIQENADNTDYEMRRISGTWVQTPVDQAKLRRAVILDARDIAEIGGGVTHPSRLLLAMQYYLEQGHKPIAVFTDEQNENNNNDILLNAVERHPEFNRLGMVKVIKKNDKKLLQLVADSSGMLVSNRRFHDIVHNDYTLQHLESRIFGFMFRGAENERRFVPDYWKGERFTRQRTEELAFHENTAALLVVDKLLSIGGL